MTDALKEMMTLATVAGTLLQYEYDPVIHLGGCTEHGKPRKANRAKKNARKARKNARRKQR